MKSTRKIISIVLAAILILSCFSMISFSASAAGGTVYFKNTVGYGNVYCYMWSGSGNPSNAQWPGKPMTNEGDDVWSYNYDQDYENIIFNDGGGQQSADIKFPGSGNIATPQGGGQFQVNWEPFSIGPTEPPTTPPVITASKKDKSTFKTDSINVTVTASNAATSYYQINGGAHVDFVETANVTLGSDIQIGGYVVLTVTAVNQYGTARENYAYIKIDPASGGSGDDGSTSPAVGGNYGTNTDGFGKRKTITVDGDKSDWDSSMLIAQGVANDDPRVYAPWAMHEIPMDNYAMYAAWDDNNLYVMYEMANVQDIVAPGEDYPLTQGNQWINNIPVFMYIYTGNGNVTHGKTAGGTLWDTGTTIDANVDHVVAYSTNASNGPFIYTADESGNLNPDVLVNKNTGISIKWGNGKTLSGKLMGINKAGGNNGREAGDSVDATLSDFYAAGHKASMDMFYEVSIPLKNLDITSDDIENNGIGIIQITTYGTSGMDCLPFDLSMQDNAAQPYSKDPSTTMEKEDEDHITVPLARIGRALSGGGGVVTPIPDVTYPNVDDPQPVTQPPTQATTAYVPPTEPPTQAPTQAPTAYVPPTEPPTQAPTQAPTTYIPPTEPPTQAPTQAPTTYVPPTEPPTQAPTAYVPPTEAPTQAPTTYVPPTAPIQPTIPWVEPTVEPTQPVTPTLPKEIVQTYTLKLNAGQSEDVSSDGKDIKYTTSNKKVATVSSKGIIKALKKGTAVIKVKDGINVYQYKLTVKTNPKLAKTTVTVKKGKTVSVKISGKASGVNISYKNTKYAKITSAKSSKTLKIKGLKKGTTTLKVVVNGVTLKLKVKVKA